MRADISKVVKNDTIESKKWFMLLIFGLSFILFLPDVQTIPNGAEHYLTLDVGETQTVLNIWGTLHATGYPLYVMTGSALVTALKAVGVSPATAPGIVSTLWTSFTLALIGLLGINIFKVRWAKVVMLLALFTYAITYTVWIHALIAEVYMMTHAILVGLLLLALWPQPVRHRIYWLALLGGVGIFHHRAIAMVIPALLYAVWPELVALVRKKPLSLLICLGLGLIGFLPYLYLPLRALAGAEWVYGQPNTLEGFIDQFMGTEAARFIGSVNSWEGLIANFQMVTDVIVQNLSALGVIAGIIGLILASLRRETRKPAITLSLSGLAAYLFHGVVYTDILSALILPITLSLFFGVLFLFQALTRWLKLDQPSPLVSLKSAFYGVVLLALLWGVIPRWTMAQDNHRFFTELIQNPTGVQLIQNARALPHNSTLMMPWGMRYFAIGFGRDAVGQLPNITTMLDHQGDYTPAFLAGDLVTHETTLYSYPVESWRERLNAPVYLNSAAPNFVSLQPQPTLAEGISPPTEIDALSVIAHEMTLSCALDQLVLQVTWWAYAQPTENLSIYVHLLDAQDAVIAQADESAPVFGWRPLSTFVTNELVRDIYTLPKLPNADRIRFGFYTHNADGSFSNLSEYIQPITCIDETVQS